MAGVDDDGAYFARTGDFSLGRFGLAGLVSAWGSTFAATGAAGFVGSAVFTGTGSDATGFVVIFFASSSAIQI